jgi:hypothetical protein
MGRVRALLTEAVERLAPSCKQLVLMRSPGRQGPVLERFRPRMEELFTVVDDLADRHGALVVDLYGAPSLGDPRLWDVDRLHLTAEGHRRVAEAVWQGLGYEPEDTEWRTPLPLTPPPGWVARRVADVRFARHHLLPWIGRRLTGRSSGDGRSPKRPDLLAYERVDLLPSEPAERLPSQRPGLLPSERADLLPSERPELLPSERPVLPPHERPTE